MNSKHEQNSLVNKVRLNIIKHNLIKRGDRVVVALSGGADSVCLFDVLDSLKAKLGFKLSACHYNHRIRGEAGDLDEEFVKKFCLDRGAEIEVSRRGLSETIKNEDDARQLRYSFFEKILLKGGSREGVKIAIAHNLNDLAETFLMRLIRGSGLRGLRSILPVRKNFIRPLLYISRPDIESYLANRGLQYRVDQTNFTDRYFRNKIRHKLIPDLEKYNNKIVEKLAQTATNLAEDYEQIDKNAADNYKLICQTAHSGVSFQRKDYLILSESQQKHLMIHIIEQLGGKNYSFTQIEKIDQLIKQNIGKKTLPLPYSLRFELQSGKITIKLTDSNNKEKNDQSEKKQ